MRKLLVCVDLVAVVAVAVAVVVAVMVVDLLTPMTLPHIAHVLHRTSIVTHSHPLALMDIPNRSRRAVVTALLPHHMCLESAPVPIVVATAAPIDSATITWLPLLHMVPPRLHRPPLHPLNFQTHCMAIVVAAPLALHISMEPIPALNVVVVEEVIISIVIV
jgi:hypothetical protein